MFLHKEVLFFSSTQTIVCSCYENVILPPTEQSKERVHELSGKQLCKWHTGICWPLLMSSLIMNSSLSLCLMPVTCCNPNKCAPVAKGARQPIQQKVQCLWAAQSLHDHQCGKKECGAFTGCPPLSLTILGMM